MATYKVDGNDLIETWQSGVSSKFKLLEHNQYGLVAVSTIAAIEEGQTRPSVGFGAIAIDARSRRAWHGDALSVLPENWNTVIRGTCIRN